MHDQESPDLSLVPTPALVEELRRRHSSFICAGRPWKPAPGNTWNLVVQGCMLTGCAGNWMDNDLTHSIARAFWVHDPPPPGMFNWSG